MIEFDPSRLVIPNLNPSVVVNLGTLPGNPNRGKARYPVHISKEPMQFFLPFTEIDGGRGVTIADEFFEEDEDGNRHGLSYFAADILPEDSVYRESCEVSLKRRFGYGDDPEIVELEKGVTFFVLWLENMGCKPYASCEGHPDGWYIAFEAPYKKALEINEILSSNPLAWTMFLRLCGKGSWALEFGRDPEIPLQWKLHTLDENAQNSIAHGFDYHKAIAAELAQ